MHMAGIRALREHRHVAVGNVLLFFCERADHGLNNGHHNDKANDNQAKYRHFIGKQAAHSILPEADGGTGNGLTVLHIGADDLKILLRRIVGPRPAPRARALLRQLLLKLFIFLFIGLALLSVCQLDARVNEAIQNIDNQVGGHQEYAIENGGAGNHGKVVIVDAGNKEFAHAGDGKQLFHNESTRQNRSSLHPSR